MNIHESYRLAGSIWITTLSLYRTGRCLSGQHGLHIHIIYIYILRLSLNHLKEYRFYDDCFALTSQDGANQPLAIPDRTGPNDNPRAARQPRATPLGCKKPQASGEQWNQVQHMKTLFYSRSKSGSPQIVGFLLMLSQSIWNQVALQRPITLVSVAKFEELPG